MVGVISWELHLNGCRSLKEKRGIIRSLKDRLKSRHNISVAETDHQDTWQRAVICAAIVASDRRRAQSVLSKADGLVATHAGVRVIDTATVFY